MFGWKSGDSAWQQACEEADRLDPGWRWEDLLARHPEVPAEKDASRLVLNAAVHIPKDWPYRQLEMQIAGIAPNRLPSPNFATNLRSALNQAGNAHELVHFAENAEFGRPADCPRPVFSHLPFDAPDELRRAAGVMHVRSFLAANDGHIEEAIVDGTGILVLAEAARHHPMLITALVAFAVRFGVQSCVERALGLGEASESILESTQQRLESAVAAPLMLDALRGERAIIEDFVRQVDAGRVTRWQLVKLQFFETVFRLDWRGPVGMFNSAVLGRIDKLEMSELLRTYTLLTQLFQESPDALRQRPHSYEQIRSNAAASVRKALVTIERVFGADQRQRAKLATLIAGLACERYRLEHGSWPQSLNVLVPDFLTMVPADPFDMQPLTYGRFTDGIVIDSVCHDKAGSINDVTSVFGVRFWNPEYRRVPSCED